MIDLNAGSTELALLAVIEVNPKLIEERRQKRKDDRTGSKKRQKEAPDGANGGCVEPSSHPDACLRGGPGLVTQHAGLVLPAVVQCRAS